MGPRYPALVEGLGALTERVNAGEGGLAALQALVDLTATVLGAAASTFMECDGDDGRTVAATGTARWALGRPVNLADPVVAGTVSRGRVWDVPVTDLPPEMAKQLRGRGFHRILGARVQLDGRLIGTLQAYFTDSDGRADDAARAVLMLLASSAGHVYRDVGGLLRGPAAAADSDLVLAAASHELRTPVTVIKGYADTLVAHWPQLSDRERWAAAGVIGQRAGDLARLVDRLLLASLSGEPSRRRGSPVPVPFDLVAALKWAAGELTPELALTADLPTALPAALGEPGAVATVLTELATNAHKYSPDGGEVLLTAGADAQTVWFRVADRGLGVRPGHVERAFERSWQAEGGDRRRFGGVGLGLYLVRRIVERQNGWVSLRPRERGGTVAEVRLPRADPAPEED